MPPPNLAGLPLRPLPPAGGGSAATNTSHILPPFMQSQQQSSWCWSAVATSVGLLFKTGQWTQCATVNGCLPGSDCCTSPTPSSCNVYGYLDQSLAYTRSLNGSTLYGSYSVADLQAQLESGNPVCARVEW
ncbi:MAG TPA: papain-like cysteine protease family protein, partial [Longimicrobium sp.]|nr:papain-like cysteine protease family protein [Longimicrobium sp.]